MMKRVKPQAEWRAELLASLMPPKPEEVEVAKAIHQIELDAYCQEKYGRTFKDQMNYGAVIEFVGEALANEMYPANISLIKSATVERFDEKLLRLAKAQHQRTQENTPQ